MKRANLFLWVWLAASLIALAAAGAPGDGLKPGLPALPALPVIPLPATNRPPRPVAAVTNIMLRWDAYTDAWFEVDASTNLLATNGWYFKTNVSIRCTSVTIPMTGPWEFYRMKTLVNH